LKGSLGTRHVARLSQINHGLRYLFCFVGGKPGPLENVGATLHCVGLLRRPFTGTGFAGPEEDPRQCLSNGLFVARALCLCHRVDRGRRDGPVDDALDCIGNLGGGLHRNPVLD
jgi:hypothetical protein